MSAARELVGPTRAWLAAAVADGWLEPVHVDAGAALEEAAPGDLFADRAVRPLVVAFFGGTGVGKSSLLNRLAGRPLARVGVERPTSHEVTLYAHEAVELAQLPDDLPVDRTRVERHADAALAGALWIDTPDIDSDDAANRDLALRWLPHVDLLVYVVSPERYRDDRGWRILGERRGRHGWLFVMNHWDQGASEQVEDFRAMLAQAGFTQPVVLRTVAADATAQDELPELARTIDELVAAQAVRELERLGEHARRRRLAAVIEAARSELERGRPETLLAAWDRAWTDAGAALERGLEWPIQVLAERLAAADGGQLARLGRRLLGRNDTAPSAAPEAPESPHSTLDAAARDAWDAWCDEKLAVALDGLVVAARGAGGLHEPLRARLADVRAAAPERARAALREQLRRAFARPGTAVQRWVHGVARLLLPISTLAALGWIGWLVVRGFHAAASGTAPFLGSDFLVHAALLVGLAAGAPYALMRWMRPSLRQTAQQGLQRGVRAACAALDLDVRAALADHERQRSARVAQADRLLAEVAASDDAFARRAGGGLLQRVLATGGSA